MCPFRAIPGGLEAPQGHEKKGHRGKDRWLPELESEEFVCFLAVRWNPKSCAFGVSEMVAEREGMGSYWFSLPTSWRTDGEVSRRHGRPQIACKESGAEVGSVPTGPLWTGGVGTQRHEKSLGLLRLICAPAPFNPKHPVTALAQLWRKDG